MPRQGLRSRDARLFPGWLRGKWLIRQPPGGRMRVGGDSLAGLEGVGWGSTPPRKGVPTPAPEGRDPCARGFEPSRVGMVTRVDGAGHPPRGGCGPASMGVGPLCARGSRPLRVGLGTLAHGGGDPCARGSAPAAVGVVTLMCGIDRVTTDPAPHPAGACRPCAFRVPAPSAMTRGPWNATILYGQRQDR